MTDTCWLSILGLEFQQRYIDANGVRTRALVAGNDSKPPLLFLHGTGGHAEAHLRNMRAHAHHFCVYAIDMVGHGFSDKPILGYEIDDYIDHVIAFMDAERLASVHISGESLGGWVAARMASRHPDRVKRLVLNTAGGRTLDPNVMARIRRLSLAAVDNPTYETIQSRLRFLMASPEDVTDELVRVRQAIYSLPNYRDTMERIMSLQDEKVRRRNLLTDSELGRIQCPTLVLWTTHDPTASVDVGRALAEAIPGAKFEIMENCGHWPQWENHLEYDRIQIQFLTGV